MSNPDFAATLDETARPTQVTVDLARLTENFHAIRAHIGAAKLMATVKANAYGHGLVPIAKHLEALKTDYLCVALLEEGIELRKAGIKTPILVFGGITPAQVPLYLEHNLSITAPSIEKLERINVIAGALGARAKVHLNIDTGMARVGIRWQNAHQLFAFAQTCAHCAIEGVYSHFANADTADLTSAREQHENFTKAVAYFADNNLPMPMRHLANSGGTLQLPSAHLDAVRPGIMLFGIYPSNDCVRSVPLKPVMQLQSQVVYFKVVEAGTPISYGHTWRAENRTRIVTVPIGYGDGYSRGFSNKGAVLIHGKRYPIAGRVCMDQMMVDIHWDEAYNGDTVTLLGSDGDAAITVEDLADWLDTIPYEILTSFNTRIPRVYINQF